jgi:hypothetical protein
MERACDVAMLIPSWSPLDDWRNRTHLYVHQRPLATEPGSRVWLCKDRRLVYTYRIDGFVELDEVAEAGWALVVSDGRRANRPLARIPDPHGVAARWIQGFRYLTPDARQFVKASPHHSQPHAHPQPAPSPDGPPEAIASTGATTHRVRRIARWLGRRR